MILIIFTLEKIKDRCFKYLKGEKMKSKWIFVPAILFTVWGSVKAADLKAGQTKFQTLCVTCHGATGKGDGPAAAGLNPKPKNLSATKRTDVELKKIIKEGGAANGMSPLMPPWGHSLSPQDIDNLVTYIRSLGKK